jgi:hypothetical protein
MMPSRTGQQPPDPSLDYADFPAASLSAGTEVVRAHGLKSPWWFSSGGRFGLPKPAGTSYFGDDVAVCLRERLGVITKAAVISPSVVANTRVSFLTMPRAWRCANLTDSSTAEYGVTNALAAEPPLLDEESGKETYQLGPSWAAILYAAGFQGIRYLARFTPGPPNAWALFGKFGAKEQPPPSIHTISGAEAFAMIGKPVTARRSSAHLDFVNPE